VITLICEVIKFWVADSDYNQMGRQPLQKQIPVGVFQPAGDWRESRDLSYPHLSQFPPHIFGAFEEQMGTISVAVGVK
jgi:hypothetical protein